MHEIQAGHVVWRPPSTAISRHLRAGPEGMTFLVYGTREPNDVCYYPRSKNLYWQGGRPDRKVGVIGLP